MQRVAQMKRPKGQKGLEVGILAILVELSKSTTKYRPLQRDKRVG